ncbi:MAG: ATPase domain-containing protein [Minicystis sp.]
MPAESATILVRGGPGVGKSVFATDTALRLGRELRGDVLYVCVEILPREVIAQRAGFDGFDPASAVDLADLGARKASGAGTTLVVGLTEMEMVSTEEGPVPDLGSAMLTLARIARERGFDPRVVVVDSLSDGYKLGGSAPRSTVDGVCKLAVEQGWALVLVEEATDVRASTWAFAVDTVLSLSVTPAGQREMMVTKHRFGPCQPGPHRLLIESGGVRVVPCFSAYRNAVRDLALPPLATDRSLRVPSDMVKDWTHFDVSDGEGRVVVVQHDDEAALHVLTARMGAFTREGSERAGLATFSLSESHETPIERVAVGLRLGTLHQMIDGEEWLEAVVSSLAETEVPIARVRIGPTHKLRVYEHAETLRKAVSLLAAVLARRGFIVVVYGADARDVIRAAIVNETWVASKAGDNPPRLKINRSGKVRALEFTATLR